MDRDLLSHLPVVRAVARRGGFAAAAGELGTSASAVSHAVRLVEDRLGAQLFARTTRSVRLTEAGESFLARIGPALDDLGAAAEALQEARGRVTGHLRQTVPHLALGLELEPVLVCLAEIETSFPDEPSVHHVRATIYEREGRPLPAGESWLRAVELGAWAAEALEGIERLCSRSGENTETGQRLHLIRMRACVVAGAPDEALEAGDQLLESGSGCAAEVLEVIERIVEARPDDAAARLARARCLLRLMKIEEATGDLRIVMDRDPGRAAEVTRLARAVVERHRSLVPASRLLADALEAIGDDREACRVLDRLLATLQGQADPGVLFARRSLAVKLGDRETERAMLERIESMTGGGDELLTLLHDEAAARRRPATPDPEEECVEAIRTGRFEDAIRGIEAMPASPFKAWVLERCGRDVEAAACLDEVHPSRGAAASAALHDRMVCRQLEGRSVALMAEAPIHPGPGSARAVTAARETQDMGCDEGGLS